MLWSAELVPEIMSCPVLLSLVSLQTLQQVLCNPGQGTINLGIGSKELNFKSPHAKEELI